MEIQVIKYSKNNINVVKMTNQKTQQKNISRELSFSNEIPSNVRDFVIGISCNLHNGDDL